MRPNSNPWHLSQSFCNFITNWYSFVESIVITENKTTIYHFLFISFEHDLKFIRSEWKWSVKIHNSWQMFFVMTNHWCKGDLKYSQKGKSLYIKSDDFRTYEVTKTNFVHYLSYISIKSFIKMHFRIKSMTSLCSISNNLIEVIAIYIKC